MKDRKQNNKADSKYTIKTNKYTGRGLIQVQIKLKHKRDHKKPWEINTGGCPINVKVGICAEISDY